MSKVWKWIKRIFCGLGRAFKAFFLEIVSIFKSEDEETETSETTETAEEEASSEAGPEAEGRPYRLSMHWLPEGIPCDTGKSFEPGYPDSVTIHWIGPYPDQTPEIVRDWWETGGGEGSAQWVVKDDEVLQSWPLTKTAWHCGNSKGNSTSVGIEVVPETKAGKFSEDSISTLRNLLNDYYPGLPLKRHYDWSGKDCPKYYIDEKRWASLKKQLGRA